LKYFIISLEIINDEYKECNPCRNARVYTNNISKSKREKES